MYVRAQALLCVKEMMEQGMSVHVFLYVCLSACFSKNKKRLYVRCGYEQCLPAWWREGDIYDKNRLHSIT